MARPKQKWSSEEEEALSAGVEKYGLGKWKTILTDPHFASALVNRSNVDLKDKWRNLTGSDYGSSNIGNARTSSLQDNNNLPIRYQEPSRSSVVKRQAPPYKSMIYEALSSVDDPNGTDIETMVEYLQPRYELPKNFRRLFSAKLRRLKLSGDLEKVGDRYKAKGTSSGAENLNEEQVEPLPTETAEDAASVAAFQVATAVHKEDQLAKTWADIDKLATLLHENNIMLRLAQDLHDRCLTDEPVNLRP